MIRLLMVQKLKYPGRKCYVPIWICKGRYVHRSFFEFKRKRDAEEWGARYVRRAQGILGEA